MDIYEALKKDHRTFEALLDRLVEQSQSGDDSWKSILLELRNELIPHAHAEEAVFYNALRDEDQSKGLVAHSYAEHAMAEAEIRALGLAKAVDAKWTSMVQKLRKDLLHHIEEEEGRVFSVAHQVFSEQEARQIGEAFERLKPEMAKDGKSIVASTLDLIVNLMPKRFSEKLRKHFHGGRKEAA